MLGSHEGSARRAARSIASSALDSRYRCRCRTMRCDVVQRGSTSFIIEIASIARPRGRARAVGFSSRQCVTRLGRRRPGRSLSGAKRVTHFERELAWLVLIRMAAARRWPPMTPRTGHADFGRSWPPIRTCAGPTPASRRPHPPSPCRVVDRRVDMIAQRGSVGPLSVAFTRMRGLEGCKRQGSACSRFARRAASTAIVAECPPGSRAGCTPRRGARRSPRPSLKSLEVTRPPAE